MFTPILSVVSGFQFGLDHITLPGWIAGGILAFLSIVSWSILVTKWHLLSRARKANRQFLSEFHDSSHPLALYLTKKRRDLSPLYHVYHAGCRELAYQLVGDEEPGRNFSVRLQGAGRVTPTQMEAVFGAMERAVSSARITLESRLPVVVTVLAAAPFLGLLGTAWGLLEIFAAVSQSGQATTVAALAPGISSALLTTVVALLVALPSLIGHNMVVALIRRMIIRMENFVSLLGAKLEREFVDYRAPAEPLPSLGSMGAPALSSAPKPPASSASLQKLSLSGA